MRLLVVGAYGLHGLDAFDPTVHRESGENLKVDLGSSGLGSEEYHRCTSGDCLIIPRDGCLRQRHPDIVSTTSTKDRAPQESDSCEGLQQF